MVTHAKVDRRIALAPRDESEAVIPALRLCIDDPLSQEREKAKGHFAEQIRVQELSVAKLESALGALQTTLNVERNGKRIDGNWLM
jgi:hypothetical protein